MPYIILIFFFSKIICWLFIVDTVTLPYNSLYSTFETFSGRCSSVSLLGSSGILECHQSWISSYLLSFFSCFTLALLSPSRLLYFCLLCYPECVSELSLGRILYIGRAPWESFRYHWCYSESHKPVSSSEFYSSSRYALVCHSSTSFTSAQDFICAFPSKPVPPWVLHPPGLAPHPYPCHTAVVEAGGAGSLLTYLGSLCLQNLSLLEPLFSSPSAVTPPQAPLSHGARCCSPLSTVQTGRFVHRTHCSCHSWLKSLQEVSVLSRTGVSLHPFAPWDMQKLASAPLQPVPASPLWAPPHCFHFLRRYSLASGFVPWAHSAPCPHKDSF